MRSAGICKDTVGIVGEWIHVGKNKTIISPLERSVGGTCKLLQTPTLYRGMSGQPTYEGAKCECPSFVDEYEWTSPQLSTPFSADHTCELLGNQTVLFIGDSTSQQAASTLMNALVPASCQTQIFSALSDTLIGCQYGAMNRGKRWNEWVEELNPDIVVLSVGAHVSKGHDAYYLGIIDMVLHEMEAMQQEKPNIKFVWKTQSPGGCTNDIVSPQNATHAFVMSEANHRYNYGRMPNRDQLLLSRLQMLNIPYLDLRMLYSRSDAHVSSPYPSNAQNDCLHMCIPGPLEVIAPLFEELLVRLNNHYTPLVFNMEYLYWIAPDYLLCK